MKNNFAQHFILILLISTSTLFSQITPDNTFGANGKVITSFGTADANMATITIQNDGKILACGSYYNGLINQIALSRYNIDGSLDNSFGTNGKVLTPIGTDGENENNTVRVLNNGKILVAGTNGTSRTSYDFVLVQYISNGSLDLSFGTNGILLSDFNNERRLSTLEIQTDNKIVVGGSITIPSSGNSSNFAIARYNTDGSKDISFGVNGLANINIGLVNNSLAESDDYVNVLKIQPDGKIIASGLTYFYNLTGGENLGLVRLNIDGSLDSSFGNNGRVITDFGESEEAGEIQILADGKIILSGGYYYNDGDNEKILIIKYNSDGSIDINYGSNGKVITDFGNPLPLAFAHSSQIQSDGKLLVIGVFKNANSDILIARYNIDGSLDTTFDADGFLFLDFGNNEGAYTSAIQSDGKLVLGGGTYNGSNNDFTLLRFDMGVLSTNDFFKNNTVNFYPNPVLNYLNLDLNLFQNEFLTVNLFDINGRKIVNLLNNIYFQSGNNSLKLDLPETLSKGIYFLNISNGKYSSNIKIVK